MISFSEAQKRIAQSINSIRANREKEVFLIAKDALAIVKNRVIQTHTDSEGNDFGGYSQAVVPAYFFKGRSRTGGDAAYSRLTKKTGYFASYKDWREANNLQTKGKDFFFSGRMWGNIKPVLKSSEGDVAMVEINAISAKEREKLGFVTAQHGNILSLSETERRLLQQMNQRRIEKHLKPLL